MVARARPHRKRHFRPKSEADPLPEETQGLGARELAAEALALVWSEGLSADQAFAKARPKCRLACESSEDRSFAQAIFFTTLRHYRQCEAVHDRLLARGLAANAHWIRAVLFSAIAQLTFLGTKDHAAVNSAVELAKLRRESRALGGLVNGVLRAHLRNDKAAPAFEPMIPPWLNSRWQAHFGAEALERLTGWMQHQAPIDLTLKPGFDPLAAGLPGKKVLPGTFRLGPEAGPLEKLSGYEEGAWWVQDAATALPLSVLGDLSGKKVLDLCAAPGGKTMQLAAAGAEVTSVDESAKRCELIEENLTRTGLKAKLVTASVDRFQAPEQFDLVVLDAPCSATGTVRRHPELAWTHQASDVGRQAKTQAHLLRRAATFVRPGGTLLYMVCSLEPEEGSQVVRDFLGKSTEFSRKSWGDALAISAAEALTPEGDILTSPMAAPLLIVNMMGWDGFFASQLVNNMTGSP